MALVASVRIAQILSLLHSWKSWLKLRGGTAAWQCAQRCTRREMCAGVGGMMSLLIQNMQLVMRRRGRGGRKPELGLHLRTTFYLCVYCFAIHMICILATSNWHWKIYKYGNGNFKLKCTWGCPRDCFTQLDAHFYASVSVIRVISSSIFMSAYLHSYLCNRNCSTKHINIYCSPYCSTFTYIVALQNGVNFMVWPQKCSVVVLPGSDK